MTTTRSGSSRFVAFSLVDGHPIAASYSIAKALQISGDLAAFGIGHHPQTEVLDCDGEAETVRRSETNLTEARRRFRTVYRAEDLDDLPAVSLTSGGGSP